MDAHEVINILNKKSGMLGISGVSSDFRDLDAAVADGNARAALAKDMFNLSVKKIIGSYVAEMGGVDAIIFTAGVGENDRSVRWDVCESTSSTSASRSTRRRTNYRGKQMDISIDWARVRVLVIPTNEGAYDRQGYRASGKRGQGSVSLSSIRQIWGRRA